MNYIIECTDLEFLWSQYNLLVELYKFYFELTLKGGIFVNGIIGVSTVYLIKNDIKSGIIFLGIVSTLFSGFLFYGAILASELNEGLKSIVKKMGLGLAPHGDFLVVSLIVFGFAYLLLSLFLSYYCRKISKGSN